MPPSPRSPAFLRGSVLLLLLSASAVSAAEPNTLTPAEIADGWILLFDGESFFGWRNSTKANWAIDQGAITVDSGEKGLLTTSTEFDNYVLKVDWKADPATNSGVFLRTGPRPEDPKADCYELNIAPQDNPFPTGSFVGRQKAAAVVADDKWHTFEAVCDRGQFTVLLDGQEVLNYIDPSPLARGRIGLQLNAGKVAFKNIKLKPLGLAPLLNGKDLAGWHPHPKSQSKFTVTPEGHLHLTGGKGCLETDGKYDDFTLQLECQVNGKQLNSGVFFRSIPGDEMNGYESQIHNGFIGGDRTKPVDCGSGGIFRRINARKVVADDGVFFAKTIIAHGPHIAVWVNGYPVTDWTDTRAPNPNPRNGLRTEAGTIQLQGHDPTTDFLFRKIRVAKLPAR